MQISSHVPSAMIRQRNSGVFARVEATGSHQQTRRAMAAKCQDPVSSVCTLSESTFNPGNLAKQTVDCEPLGSQRCRVRLGNVAHRTETFSQDDPFKRSAACAVRLR